MTSSTRLSALREQVRGLLDESALRLSDLLTARVERARVARLRTRARIDASAQILPESRIENLRGDPSRMNIGAHTAVRGELITLGHGGRIDIGAWCYVGASTRVWSASHVAIGDRVLIAHGCDIHDWNAHPLDAQARHRHYRDILEGGHPQELGDVPAVPVRIEDDVWIGFGSVVMKGVTIGRGSVVAARSLVTKSVAPGWLVGGSPAVPIREIPISTPSPDEPP